jgi:hypothetical protein
VGRYGGGRREGKVGEWVMSNDVMDFVFGGSDEYIRRAGCGGSSAAYGVVLQRIIGK